jgi:hypothetical protein
VLQPLRVVPVAVRRFWDSSTRGRSRHGRCSCNRRSAAIWSTCAERDHGADRIFGIRRSSPTICDSNSMNRPSNPWSSSKSASSWRRLWLRNRPAASLAAKPRVAVLTRRSVCASRGSTWTIPDAPLGDPQDDLNIIVVMEQATQLRRRPSSFVAAGVEDAGFWPVISLPSITT